MRHPTAGLITAAAIGWFACPWGAAQDYALLVGPSQGAAHGLGGEKEQRTGEEDGGLSDIWGHGMGLSYAESKQSKGN